MAEALHVTSLPSYPVELMLLLLDDHFHLPVEKTAMRRLYLLIWQHKRIEKVQ